MTSILQYNVNNHILDGSYCIWWPNAFPSDEFGFALSKDLLNFEPPTESASYAPCTFIIIPGFLIRLYGTPLDRSSLAQQTGKSGIIIVVHDKTCQNDAICNKLCKH